MNQRPVKLEDMLLCREERANRIRELCDSSRGTVISISMNIAGEFKVFPLSHIAFFESIKKIEDMLTITRKELKHAHTGDEAILIACESPEEVKSKTVALETKTQIGRLYDIDVFDFDGNKLSRNVQRLCLICTEPAAACARSRAHSLAELTAKTLDILRRHFSSMLSTLAYDALLAEVEATPKPGLVDMNNSGAHSDMSLSTFYTSADALRTYFEDIAYYMMCNSDMPASEIMPRLTEFGLEAEKTMLRATSNVNTHKGAIFSLGLIVCSVAYCFETGKDIQGALTYASSLISTRDLPPDDTNGAAVRKSHGEVGAFSEALAGFPTVAYALSRLEYYLACGSTKNDASVFSLLDIISKSDDTNVLHRTGRSGHDFMKQSVGDICALAPHERMKAALMLDEQFIAKNISPGGCADMLACALFLHSVFKFYDFA